MIRRSMLLIPIVIVALTAAGIWAQVGTPLPAGPPPGMQAQPFPKPPAPMPENPLRVMSRFLQLTPEQAEGVRGLLEARRSVVEPLTQEIAAKEKELRDLIAAGTDPASVGRTVIAIDGLRKQVGEAHQRFAASFQELLTPDQKTQLQAIQRAARLQPVVGAARELGII
ncbi:MAG: motif family protein [Acidobacteria bacterium]|nr:motif family protein [Acidobacteriota bacterium]